MVFNSGLFTVNPVIMYIVYSSENGHLKMAKKKKKGSNPTLSFSTKLLAFYGSIAKHSICLHDIPVR